MNINQEKMSQIFVNHIFQERVAVKFNNKFMTITLTVGDMKVICRYKAETVKKVNFDIYVPTFCTVYTALDALMKIPQTDKQHEAYRKFVIGTLQATKAQNVVFTYEKQEKPNARN